MLFTALQFYLLGLYASNPSFPTETHVDFLEPLYGCHHLLVLLWCFLVAEDILFVCVRVQLQNKMSADAKSPVWAGHPYVVVWMLCVCVMVAVFVGTSRLNQRPPKEVWTVREEDGRVSSTGSVTGNGPGWIWLGSFKTSVFLCKPEEARNQCSLFLTSAALYWLNLLGPCASL